VYDHYRKGSMELNTFSPLYARITSRKCIGVGGEVRWVFGMCLLPALWPGRADRVYLRFEASAYCTKYDRLNFSAEQLALIANYQGFKY